MKILVILFAVLGLFIYDYVHDKTIIKTTGAWIKYVVAFGCGLLYTAITALPFFQWLVIAGIVVLGGLFWGIISKWVIALYYKATKKTPPPVK